jgi:hypothetical protein
VNLFLDIPVQTEVPFSAARCRLFGGASPPHARCESRVYGKVFLAIYGNGSANKMPAAEIYPGGSVLLDYEFYCRYLDGLAEFFTPSHEHTLNAGNAQPKHC